MLKKIKQSFNNILIAYNRLSPWKNHIFLYGVKWRYFLYESCSSQWDLHLYDFEFFNLRSLRCSKKLNKVLAVY
jgi:hypothetical protein